ncbi:glycoside hydrolase family 2 TIM barrel-domain containing protein [Botrimarina sp.]|uniref:glycoside hydrolase family 2 TIM barrel-domain containing protein n=1 Tax=Botrimarina sp. TaxID=2795802 RepID=UPI0032EE1135
MTPLPTQAAAVRRSLLLLAASVFSLSFAGAATPDWENEQVIQRNRLPARATFWPMGSAEAARRGDRDASPCVKSLDGDWRFHWSPTPEGAPLAFWREGFDATSWAKLPVPSNWQTHGYGTPIYKASGYPFRIDPPRVTSEPPEDWTVHGERNPVGCYLRDFELPELWAGRRVFLHLAGVEGAVEARVNGRRVGYSQGSRSPAEFEITAYLKPGANRIALKVFRYSDGSYLEDQDMWRLAGVFREVVLYATPAARIADFTVRTDLDDDYRDARLAIDLELDAAEPLGGWSVAAQLYDADGAALFAEPLTHDAAPILNLEQNADVLVDRTPQRGPAKFGWLTARVADPKKWTAETPHLYRLVLSLVDPQGNTAQAVACDVGFREVHIADGRLLVNGRPVKLRGVNRHEHDPATGHAQSLQSMRRDIRLIKQANLNAVRTAHYPNDPRWYELCDRLGLYLIDEADLETHGLRGRLAGDPRWLPALLDRGVRLVERDKNHPSVIAWSLGNESGWGANLAALAGWVHGADPTRPVHYEGAQGEPDPPEVDFISRFYPRVREEYLHPDLPQDPAAAERPENARWERLLDLAEAAQRRGDPRPVLASEYAHAMGNAVGNLQAYWDEIWANDRLLGGFLWDWSDQALWAETDSGEPYLGYGGAFGDEPNHGAFCLNGLVMADRALTAKYWQAKKTLQPAAVSLVGLADGADGGQRVALEITNRRDHADLADLQVAWRLEADGAPIADGVEEPIAIQPGESETLVVELPASSAPGERFLRVALRHEDATDWAPARHEVAWEQIELPAAEPLKVAPADAPPLAIEENEKSIVLRGAGFEAVFDRRAAALTSLRHGGRDLLAGPLRPQAYRAPTDNDRGFGSWLAKEWTEAGLDSAELEPSGATVERIDSAHALVDVRTALVTRRGQIEVAQTWRVSGDGRLEADVRFTPEGELPPLPRLGLVAAAPGRLDRVEWLGRGPWESYPDRLAACDVGRYAGLLAEQATPYPRPQETGSHEQTRWVALSDSSGAGLLVLATGEPFAFSALPYSAGDLAAAKRWVDLEPRGETFLSLDAAQCGLGNSSCGPGVLKEHAVLPGPVSLRFALVPLSPDDDPAPTARRVRQQLSEQP